MGTTRLLFARAVLVRGDFQRGSEYEKSLVAIMAGEGSLAHWNPMDTTLQRPGATPYNSFGANNAEHVWNYASAHDGVEATILTMMQPNMAPWVNLLKEPGHNAIQLCVGFSRCPWGGVGDTLPLRLARQWRTDWIGYLHERRGIVAGNGPWTYTRRGKPRR